MKSLLMEAAQTVNHYPRLIKLNNNTKIYFEYENYK